MKFNLETSLSKNKSITQSRNTRVFLSNVGIFDKYTFLQINQAKNPEIFTPKNVAIPVLFPIIADYERENPYFKESVKLAITPMLSTLAIMENAESESEVLGLGLSVIALNLGIYLGAPAIVIISIRKNSKN